jgi:hypothetical protein
MLDRGGLFTAIGSVESGTADLPDWIVEPLAEWVKSLQDPDGYFYNYQWTKASHGTSRLARDLSSSMSILNSLGLKPTYDTHLGDSGDHRVVPLPDAAVPVAYQNTHSTVSAVSKVVLAAHADYLENCDTLLAYLNDREANMGSSRFYGIGSNITSQMNQIIARDKELRKEYEKLPADQRTEPYESMVDLVIDWFNDRQNPETGHWESTDSHIAVSGILKIMGIYNSAKVPVAYAEKMALAAFNAIEGEEEFTSVAALYNTWSSILKILGNLRSYGKPEEVDGVMMTGVNKELSKNNLKFIDSVEKDGIKTVTELDYSGENGAQVTGYQVDLEKARQAKANDKE